MRIAVYARVSTQRQSQMQTIEQQLERLQEHVQKQGWEWQEELVFRDDGYSDEHQLVRIEGFGLLAPSSAVGFILLTCPDRLFLSGPV